MKRLRFRYIWRESWCNCVWKTLYLILLSTCQRKHSSPAISTSWPQPWSRGEASAYNWRNTPSELCDFHSQPQGRCWYFRRALEHSPRRSGESDQPPARIEIIGPFGSQNLTADLHWMYLTTRDLTSWSQPYHDDKCTKQLYSVWILSVNYKRIMNRHARRIDPRVDELAS